MDIERMKIAVEDAQEWAQNIKVGDTFMGALPEAEKRGFKRDSAEYRLFISVAIDYLPERITIDSYGKVISLS